jgi:hypothetical protein
MSKRGTLEAEGSPRCIWGWKIFNFQIPCRRKFVKHPEGIYKLYAAMS